MSGQFALDNVRSHRITQHGDTVTLVFADGDPMDENVTSVQVEMTVEGFAGFLRDALGATA
ncbi:hypothetical protein [Amycolatopsis sp. NPDC004079]|uniref:hypothetical protein n=1 Tax=Amycolatopsis sp. NPDC004079 TaxID=3154549 RepID=UPI0033A99C76